MNKLDDFLKKYEEVEIYFFNEQYGFDDEKIIAFQFYKGELICSYSGMFTNTNHAYTENEIKSYFKNFYDESAFDIVTNENTIQFFDKNIDKDELKGFIELKKINFSESIILKSMDLI
nr:hypothetical protein [uncultured Fusobacterium sp.]